MDIFASWKHLIARSDLDDARGSLLVAVSDASRPIDAPQLRNTLALAFASGDADLATAVLRRFGGSSISLAFKQISCPHLAFVLAGGEQLTASFHRYQVDDIYIELIVDRFLGILDLLVRYGEGLQQPAEIIVNLDDCGHGVGFNFCDNTNLDALIPDFIFLGSKGYAGVRTYFEHEVSSWDARTSVAYWRGSTTGHREATDVFSLPRAKLCALGKSNQDLIDARLVDLVQVSAAEQDTLISAGLTAERDDWRALSKYRFHIDIDGNTNSWPGLMFKLLSGGLVFKVESPFGFRQWFYDRLKSGEHYVTVRSDLSDLVAKIEHFRDDPVAAERIAENGLRLARSLDHESETLIAVQRMRGMQSSAA